MHVSHPSDYRVFPHPSAGLKPQAEAMGYAAILLSGSNVHRDWSLATLRHLVEAALAQNRVKFYFNDDGNVVGYVIWAWLAPDVAHRVKTEGWSQLHESEWNEGDGLRIVDMLAPYRHFPYVLAGLRQTLLHGCHELHYARIKRGKRRVTRLRRAGAGAPG